MATQNKPPLEQVDRELADLVTPPRKNVYNDPRLTGLSLDKVETYNSFSGADIQALIAMPHGHSGEPKYQVLGNLQTISYSIYREKVPVRALGFVGDKGTARGTRTIAGSLVFTVFDRHVLWDVLRRDTGDRGKNSMFPDTGYLDLEYVMVDQLPPFDIVIHFANEYGYAAEMVLFGIELSQEGQVMSIQDMITENVMQFTARHMALMRPGGHKTILDELIDTAGNPVGQPARTFKSIMNQGEHSNSIKQLIRQAHNPFR